MKTSLAFGIAVLLSALGRCQQSIELRDSIPLNPMLFGMRVGQGVSTAEGLADSFGVHFEILVGIDETSIGDSSKIYRSAQVSLSYSKPEGGEWRLLGTTATCDSCFSLNPGLPITVGSSVYDVTEAYPEFLTGISSDVLADSVRMRRIGSLSVPFSRSVDHVSVYPEGLVHVYFDDGRVTRSAIQHQLE